MYETIVRSIICSQFESTFGYGAARDTNSDPTHAMQVTFSLSPNYEVEDGYRHLTLLLFGGGTRYIAVYAKLGWTVTFNEDTGEEPHYTEGETPWVCYGYHDSCWRDSVEDILREFHDRISTIDFLFNGATGWYKNVSLTEDQIEEFRSIRNARYKQDAEPEWEKVSDLEFHFLHQHKLAATTTQSFKLLCQKECGVETMPRNR